MAIVALHAVQEAPQQTFRLNRRFFKLPLRVRRGYQTHQAYGATQLTNINCASRGYFNEQQSIANTEQLMLRGKQPNIDVQQCTG